MMAKRSGISADHSTRYTRFTRHNMSLPDLNMDELNEARSESIKATIHPVEVAELTTLGETLFPSIDHPWREKFLHFINENAGEKFYHGITHDRVHIIYCHAKDRGIWFIPGSGTGPLQAKGRAILKGIVEGAK